VLPRFCEAMAAGMSEATLQENVLHTARSLGWLAYHTYDSRRCVPGFPDLVLAHEGQRRLIFSELKTEKGRQTREQRAWERVLSAIPGVEVYLWRPTGWLDGSIVRILQGAPGAA
jgi:hypothetical protein